MSAASTMSTPPQRKTSQKKWKMPLAAFSGTSQLEVITTIANCGDRTELATEAVFKWIRGKQDKGRTRFEILGKLELLENKFKQFESLHDCFHVARRATGLPPSRILNGGNRYPSQASLPALSEEPSSNGIVHDPVTPTPSRPEPLQEAEAEKNQSSQPVTEWEAVATPTLDRSTTPIPQPTLTFETKRPPPLRLRTLLDARGRIARRHSIASPISATPPEDGRVTPTASNPLPMELLHRRMASDDTSSPRSAGSAGVYKPTWPTPAVAFDPPPGATPSMTSSDYSPDSSTADDTSVSRPSTSTSSYTNYSGISRAPSISSFHILDSVRQSVQPKFDPDLVDSLFNGSSAQHFLRIFRPE